MTLEELIQRTNAIEEGDGWVGHCPAHDDEHRSLRIAVGETGKVILKCRAGCDSRDVVDKLGVRFADLEVGSMVSPKPVVRRVDSEPDVAAQARLAVDLDRWAAALDDETVAYATRRFGLDRAACERLGLGTATDLGGGKRLVVPFPDEHGIPRGYQARALDPDAKVRWMGPHGPSAKVGLLRADSGWAEIVVTEGPSDALTAVGAGYDAIAVRGASLGSNATVADDIAGMASGRPVVVAGDGDTAGRRFSIELARRLAERGLDVRVLPVPDGDDLNAVRMRLGDGFQRWLIDNIAAAEPVSQPEAVIAERDPDTYPLTDLGQAMYVRDFIRSRGSDVRFTPELGFLLEDRGVWLQDTLNRVRSYAQAAAKHVGDLAATLPDGTAEERQEKKRWTTFAHRSQTTERISAVVSELKALEGIALSIDSFDQHHDLLAVLNGVVDLRTGELMESNPGLLLTKRVDIEYDPSAKAPRWEQFLREILPHPGLPEFMQRLIGYGITGRTDEQCFAVLWGTGANGKSVFTSTLSRVFGPITATTPFSTFEAKQNGGIPNDIAALRGSRLTFTSEGEAGKPMAEALVKRVTGQDPIAARLLYKEWMTFEPTFLLIMVTNSKPNFRSVDQGLWRRVKLIPFDRYFPPEERDDKLARKLLSEAPGILAWAVRGAVQWYKSGLQEPDLVIEATSEYREASDALSGFLPGVYVYDPEATAEPANEIYNRYVEWTMDENLQPKERWARRTFYRGLEERGLKRRMLHGYPVFDGIRLAYPPERVD